MRQPHVQPPRCNGSLRAALDPEPKCCGQLGKILRVCLRPWWRPRVKKLGKIYVFLLERHKIFIEQNNLVKASKRTSEQPLFAVPELNPHPVHYCILYYSAGQLRRDTHLRGKHFHYFNHLSKEFLEQMMPHLKALI